MNPLYLYYCDLFIDIGQDLQIITVLSVFNRTQKIPTDCECEGAKVLICRQCRTQCG